MGSINVKSAATVEQETYDSAISQGKQRIGNAADEARKRYITAILGQPETYSEKWREVVEYRNSGTVGRYLDKESTRRGLTVEALATEIEARRDQWDNINSSIEAERVGGKEEVGSATDAASATSAADAAVSVIEEI
jgi:Cft2 family RNA processing exonuclease